MASACVNNIGIPSDNFLDSSRTSYTSYGWLSPRASFSRDESSVKTPGPDLESSPSDFEFRLENPVALIPADELFFDGKLMPLHFPSVKSEIQSPPPCLRVAAEITYADPYIFSPRAPRCSSRWREILGFKKTNTPVAADASAKNENLKTESSKIKSLKQFLHRNSKLVSSSSTSSSDSSLTQPLLKDLDSESISISSSRLSLSSSSSSHDHDDLPRLSLDSDKPIKSNHRMKPIPSRSEKSHRMGRSPVRRTESSGVRSREVSMDSPRMNSSGKIVFHSLERSSSSPSSFNGGPRLKLNGGIERSYSANVRVTPVLNVPVSSLRGSSKSGAAFGFGHLFSSPQKRSEVTGNGGNSKAQARYCRNRIVRA